MVAARQATEPMMNYLRSLHAERVDFGFDPNKTDYTFAEAKALIEGGKAADRKGIKRVEPGYYIDSEQHVFHVIESKQNPGRTYAKVLVVKESPKRANWVYMPGAVGSLVGLVRLTVEEAGRLSYQHGICVICAKTLTKQESVARGIGPVCRKRLAGLAELPAPEAVPAPVPARRGPLASPAPAPVAEDDYVVQQAVAIVTNKPHDCENYDGECRWMAGFHGNEQDAPEAHRAALRRLATDQAVLRELRRL